MAQLRFSELSAPRQTLIRRCQQIGFGRIGPFQVSNCEPAITPDTDVFVDLKLDGHEAPRPEYNLGDFELSKEVVRLFRQIDAIRDGVVEQLEVRAGLPRRIVFKLPNSAESR